MIRAVCFCVAAALATAQKRLEVLQFTMSHVDVAPRAFDIGSVHGLSGPAHIGPQVISTGDHVATQAQAIAMQLLFERVDAAFRSRGPAVELIDFRFHGVKQFLLFQGSLLLGLDVFS